MTLAELRDILRRSDVGDWERLPSGGSYGPTYLNAFEELRGSGDAHWLEVESHHSRATYRADVSLGIAWGLARRDDRRVFEWLKFPERDSSPQVLDVLWCGSLVDRYLGLVVDGGRAVVPYPTGEHEQSDVDDAALTRYVVTETQDSVWRLANGLSGNADYDDYRARVPFEVVPG